MSIPEDLTSLSDDELASLSEDIRSQAEGLAESAATDDAALAEIESLVAAFDRVNSEIAGREAERTERAERAKAALDKLSGTPDMPEADAPEMEQAASATGTATFGDEGEGEVEVEGSDSEAADDDEVEAPEEEAPAEEAEGEADEADAPADEATETEVADEAPTDEVTDDEGEAPADTPTATEPVAASADDEAPETATLDADDTATATAAADNTEDTSMEGTTSDINPEFSTEDAVTTTDTTAAEALASHVPDELDPVEGDTRTGAILEASNALPGAAEGTPLGNRELAVAITKKRHGMNNASAGTYERIVLATAQTDYAHKATGGAVENFEVFETVRREWEASRREQTSLVASGGNCAPIPPSFEFFRLAEEMNPVESALPPVEAPRGGIRFITPPNWADAKGGVRVTTEAQDAAGYGNGSGQVPPKPCVVVECSPVEECRVDAVSKCVQFGNLNYRVFPEQVEAFLADLSVAFTAEKEVFYLDAIDGASTAVTAQPAYGATRGATTTLLIAAANYRRRHHMSETAVLSLFLPSWFVDLVKADMVNDHSMGLGFLTAGTAEVNAWLASQNLDVTWYYDGATGAGQDFADAQGAGDLNAFPTSVVGYLFAPGTFVRLDAGTLDVGIVRDSILNGTNDLQLFSEQWVQVCQVGLESVRLEITLCPDGTAPEPVIPLSCGASA